MCQIRNSKVGFILSDKLFKIGNKNQLSVDYRKIFLADSEAFTVWLCDQCAHDAILVKLNLQN